jgi:hypothetical protein
MEAILSDANQPDDDATSYDERFARLVSAWDAHGDSHTARISDGIAYSAFLRSLGLNDEASHLIRESWLTGDDDEGMGWLGMSAT